MHVKTRYKVLFILATLVVLGNVAFIAARLITYTNAFTDSASWLNPAIEADDATALRILLAMGADPNGEPTSQSPLSYAAAFGRVKMIRLLLSHGADPNAASSGEGKPLLTAALSRQWDAARVLEEAGAQRGFVDMVFLRDEEGVRKALANEPDLLETEKLFGAPLLLSAVEFGHTDGARLLLEVGADPAEPGPDGLSALDLVRRLNHEKWNALFDEFAAGPSTAE